MRVSSDARACSVHGCKFTKEKGGYCLTHYYQYVVKKGAIVREMPPAEDKMKSNFPGALSFPVRLRRVVPAAPTQRSSSSSDHSDVAHARNVSVLPPPPSHAPPGPPLPSYAAPLAPTPSAPSYAAPLAPVPSPPSYAAPLVPAPPAPSYAAPAAPVPPSPYTAPSPPIPAPNHEAPPAPQPVGVRTSLKDITAVTSSSQPSPSAPSTSQPLNFCTECGVKRVLPGKYCSNCGTEFEMPGLKRTFSDPPAPVRPPSVASAAAKSALPFRSPRFKPARCHYCTAPIEGAAKLVDGEKYCNQCYLGLTTSLAKALHNVQFHPAVQQPVPPPSVVDVSSVPFGDPSRAYVPKNTSDKELKAFFLSLYKT